MGGAQMLRVCCQLDMMLFMLKHHRDGLAVGITTGRSQYWNARDLTKLGLKLAKTRMTIQQRPLRVILVVVL